MAASSLSAFTTKEPKDAIGIPSGLFAVTTNRFGEDRRPHGRVRFTGRSQITTPRGEVLRRAPSQREELFLCEIDPREARNKKMTAGNHILADRRPEFYA